MNQPKRLFIGCYPTGYVFADRKVEEHGDYRRLAYINYATLELDLENKVPKDCLKYIQHYHNLLLQKKGEVAKIAGNAHVVLGSKSMTPAEIDTAYLKGVYNV